MTHLLTQTAVADLCVTVGFTPANARIASAIAMCEGPGPAGFCDMDLIGDQALADTTWGFSYGAFQIRSLRAQTGTGLFRDAQKLTVPTFNCTSAFIVWTQSGFNAWTTYVDGAYRAYLPDQFPPAPGTYVVVGGDTLSGIGVKLGIVWQDVARLNSLHDPWTLNIGQVLQLPFVEYTVVSGDTLGSIAAKKITVATWQAIAAYNHLTNPDLIYPLQKLRLPK